MGLDRPTDFALPSRLGPRHPGAPRTQRLGWQSSGQHHQGAPNSRQSCRSLLGLKKLFLIHVPAANAASTGISATWDVFFLHQIAAEVSLSRAKRSKAHTRSTSTLSREPGHEISTESHLSRESLSWAHRHAPVPTARMVTRVYGPVPITAPHPSRSPSPTPQQAPCSPNLPAAGKPWTSF